MPRVRKHATSAALILTAFHYLTVKFSVSLRRTSQIQYFQYISGPKPGIASGIHQITNSDIKLHDETWLFTTRGSDL